MRILSTLLTARFLLQFISVNVAVLSAHAHSSSSPGLENPVNSLEAAAAIPFSKASHRGRIDTHCHYIPSWYKELLNARNLTAGGRSIPDWSPAEHLALNEKVGAETCVLSISNPGVKFSVDEPVEEGRELARKLNEYGRDLTADYPGQFLYFATLTLPDLEGSVAEAIHALDNLNAAGVVVEANAFGELFGTTRYAPLYKELNDRHATVFIHPSASPCPEISRSPELALELSEGVPPYAADFLLDSVRAAINLVYKDVTKDYPDITFILSHSGGFLPFTATRAVNLLAILTKGVSLTDQWTSDFYTGLQKFHADIAISATEIALPLTSTFFGTNSLTYGSDFPHAPVEFIVANTKSYENFRFSTSESVGLDSSSSPRARIDYGNAYALFGKYLSRENLQDREAK